METLTITPVELRIEDYYLMREEKVPHHVADRIKEAARKNCFNPEIIQRKMDKPKSVTLDVFKDVDALKEFMKKKSGNNHVGLNWAGSSPRDNSKDNKGSYEGRSNNIFGNNSSNNIVSRNGLGYGGSSGGNKPDNVFMNTRTQGGGLFDNHPGGTSGNGNGGGSGNQGIFSKGYGGTNIGGSDNNRMSSGNGSGNNNIFGKGGQGTGAGSSGNMFSNQNTGSNNTGGNKIFGNNDSSNTRTNIFGANNSNNSGNNNNGNNNKGNIFGNNQNQGGSNQTNIFGNNQNNNNQNNNNQNNNNQNTNNQNTNKIFTNNSNNNNNIFNNNNNNQNNNNNTLFNNNQNNNQGKPSIPP